MSDTRTIRDVLMDKIGYTPVGTLGKGFAAGLEFVIAALGLDPDTVLDKDCETCEGTGKSPRPADWDQMAHLDSGTCQCHDSWDQCPCADDSHSPDCDCCPGGTGLCGPLPCRTCNGTGRVEVKRVVAVPAPYDLYHDLRALRIGRAVLASEQSNEHLGWGFWSEGWNAARAEFLAAGDDDE